VKRAVRRPGVSLTALGSCLLAALAVTLGCRTAAVKEPAGPPWDVGRAEVIRWTAGEPSFAQGFAIEASGLAASEHGLVLVSEKYARLLIIDPDGEHRARIRRLDVPLHSELEGVAVSDGRVILCDEAHAAVYELAAGERSWWRGDGNDTALAVRRLPLEGVDVEGGKIGFEGIEVDRDDGTVYVLLERSDAGGGGCVSRIYRLRRQDGGGLAAAREPLDVRLQDCTWRLTGLAWWQERLIALRTQYPGERYEVVAIDLATGAARVILDLTTLLRELEGRGWGNNVEGVAVTRDGALWLVSDNAVTGRVDDPAPPLAESRTLLLRIPPRSNAR